MDEHSCYWPRVSGGTTSRRLQLGPYTVRVDTDVESPGKVLYEHVLFVHDAGDVLRMCVASERSERHAELVARGEEPPGGSHFLGVFTGEEHQNLGSSDDWADLDAFTTRALELVRERLRLTEPPSDD